jgi:hypothetical protein
LLRSEERCWREGRFRTPLLGFSKDCPSVDVKFAHPLPASARTSVVPKDSRGRGCSHLPRGAWTCVPSPSARSCQTPDSFRPCRSSRLRRFALLELLQVCCTLLPTMGFTTFQARATSFPRFTAAWTLPKEALAARNRQAMRRASSFPWCFHPPERSPRRQPRRVTAAVALSPSGALHAALPPSRRKAPARPVATPPTSRP